MALKELIDLINFNVKEDKKKMITLLGLFKCEHKK